MTSPDDPANDKPLGELGGSAYFMPRRLFSAEGAPRRVGVEIELSGVELAVIADQLVAQYGGTIQCLSEYEFKVKGTALGDFKVDLDFEYLQKIGRRDLEHNRDCFREFEHLAADAILALMGNLIPCELIAPPLPFDRLFELDSIVETLRERGANGSRHSLLAAFGVHLNPELPDLSAATILTYLRAFICLQAWLEDQEDVDLSRKLSPFIRSYPKGYENLVLEQSYAPSLTQLIDDYLEHNPTRNRMLDMLPLFAFLDEARVMNAVPGQKIRKRPTLHYRLPNSDIDNPNWGIWQSWNDWQEVEFLADDPLRLGQVCDALQQSRAAGFFSLGEDPWKEDVKQWLSDPS